MDVRPGSTGHCWGDAGLDPAKGVGWEALRVPSLAMPDQLVLGRAPSPPFLQGAWGGYTTLCSLGGSSCPPSLSHHRINSLSEALDDLYKEFNALKGRLGELSTRFEGVEAFMDEMNTSRGQTPAKPPIRAAQPEADKPVAATPAKRRRVLIRNNRKPVEQPGDGSQ